MAIDLIRPLPQEPLPNGLRDFLRSVWKILSVMTQASKVNAVDSCTIAAGATYNQTDANKVISDLNVAIAKQNEVIAALKSAGLMAE